MSEFNHLQAIRKIEVKISSVSTAASAPAQARNSVKDYLRLRELAGLDAETISITLGMGQSRRRAGMVRDVTGRFVRSLLQNKDSLQVETLRVGGKEPDDEAVILDLLHGRLRHEVVIKVRGRYASYNQRLSAVETAFNENKSFLTEA
jgi:hypothetical protein